MRPLHVRVAASDGRVLRDILIRPRREQPRDGVTDLEVLVSRFGGFDDLAAPASAEVLVRRSIFGWPSGRTELELVHEAVGHVKTARALLPQRRRSS